MENQPITKALGVYNSTLEALERAEDNVQKALEQLKKFAQGSTFEVEGKYFQIRKRKNSFYLCELTDKPKGRPRMKPELTEEEKLAKAEAKAQEREAKKAERELQREETKKQRAAAREVRKAERLAAREAEKADRKAAKVALKAAMKAAAEAVQKEYEADARTAAKAEDAVFAETYVADSDKPNNLTENTSSLQ